MKSISYRERVLELALSIIGLLSVLLSVFAIRRVGVGLDAGVDTVAANEVRNISSSDSLTDAYEKVYFTSEFYGVLIQWSADKLNEAFGSGGFLPTSSLETYQIQAGITLALSVVSALLTGLVVAHILRSRISGLFVVASLLSLPLIMGHSVLNFKDSPTASGVLLVSAGSALMWLIPNWSRALSSAILIAAGTFLALGVRIGSWIIVAIVLSVSSLLLTLYLVWTNGGRSILVRVFVPAVGFVLGAAGIYLMHPIARIDLARWAWDAFLVSRSYPWTASVRTFGQDLLSTDLPAWYVPAWLIAQMPVLILLLMVAGCGYWLLSVVRELKTVVGDGIQGSDESAKSLAFSPFAVQGLLFPVIFAVSGITMYDGIRHLSFSVAGLVVLMAPLVGELAKKVVEPPLADSRASRPFILALILVIPAANLLASYRWFPYMYAHVNVVTSALEKDRSWEYDYWGATVLEGVERLREEGLDKIVISPPIVGPGIPEIADVASLSQISSGEEFGLYVFFRWDASIPSDGCRRIFEIARGGVTLGAGAVCRGSESLENLEINVLYREDS